MLLRKAHIPYNQNAIFHKSVMLSHCPLPLKCVPPLTLYDFNSAMASCSKDPGNAAILIFYRHFPSLDSSATGEYKIPDQQDSASTSGSSSMEIVLVIVLSHPGFRHSLMQAKQCISLDRSNSTSRSIGQFSASEHNIRFPIRERYNCRDFFCFFSACPAKFHVAVHAVLSLSSFS